MLAAQEVTLLQCYALHMKVTQLSSGTLLMIKDVPMDGPDFPALCGVLERLQDGLFIDPSCHADRTLWLAVCNREVENENPVGTLVTTLADAGINFPGAASYKSKALP